MTFRHWLVVSTALGLSSVAACGGSNEDTNTATAGNAGSAGTATGGTSAGGSGGTVTSGGAGGASGSGGFLTIDGGGTPDGFPDGAVLADGGLFDCGGCACDGKTHYCLRIAAGALRAPPPPDAPSCDDAGANDCQPLPANCGGVPSCTCLPSPYGGACNCNDVGGGLEVFCALP